MPGRGFEPLEMGGYVSEDYTKQSIFIVQCR
jgi:hypothetical protein